jgi:ATP phosphoribosyltransferase regulatory subunit
LDLRGNRETIETADKLVQDPHGKTILADMKELSAILGEYGVGEHVKFDFTLVSHMEYYTGYVFEGLDENIGFPVASGGRYDELLGKFNEPAPATGFAVFFDRLIEAVGKEEPPPYSVCVFYIAERRAEALELACAKRNKGECVVLQDVKGVTDMEEFAEKFDEVVYYVKEEVEQ